MTIRATKKQMDDLFGCHNGVGFVMWKKSKNEIVQTEFWLKDGRPCYLTTGAPVEFNADPARMDDND